MSSLYVNESGAVISIDGGYLCVTLKNGLVGKLPKELVENITIFGNSSITTPCLQECLRRGICVNYFSGKGAYYGRLTSTRHVNGERLKRQIYACDDTAFRLSLAKKIISAKIQNQSVVLHRYVRNHPADLTVEFQSLRQMEHRLERCSTIEELMGVEGMAARTYFGGLSKLVDPQFSFHGRSRQPPRDAFNSMLSLGYTILLYEIYAEIENRGLSPYVGFLHSEHRGHPTLASDLMEEWRAVVVDSLVMSLIQGHEILIEQFAEDLETGGILLQPDAMRIFIKKFEKKMETSVKYLGASSNSLRRCLYLQTADFVRAVEDRDPELYQPVLIR